MRNGLLTRGWTYYFRRSVPKNIRHLFQLITASRELNGFGRLG